MHLKLFYSWLRLFNLVFKFLYLLSPAWKEGMYTLRFRNNINVTQLYYNLGRRLGRKTNCTRLAFGDCNVITDTWCSPSSSPPIKLEYPENIYANLKNIRPNKTTTDMRWELKGMDRYNQDFRLCLEHQQKQAHGLEHASTSIDCKTNYCSETHRFKCNELRFRKDTSSMCDFRWNSSLNSGFLSIKMDGKEEGDNQEGNAGVNRQAVNLPQLSLKTTDLMINLICFIKDDAYNLKYVFNQPIVVSKQNEKLPIENKTTTSGLKSVTAHASGKAVLFMGILSTALIIAAIMAYFRHHRRRSKHKCNGIHRIPMELNPLYQADSDSDIGGMSLRDEESEVLPHWLTARPEMIYHNQSITKGQTLGHGQYGTVFKGKLTQGNAV